MSRKQSIATFKNSVAKGNRIAKSDKNRFTPNLKVFNLFFFYFSWVFYTTFELLLIMVHFTNILVKQL